MLAHRHNPNRDSRPKRNPAAVSTPWLSTHEVQDWPTRHILFCKRTTGRLGLPKHGRQRYARQKDVELERRCIALWLCNKSDRKIRTERKQYLVSQQLSVAQVTIVRHAKPHGDVVDKRLPQNERRFGTHKASAGVASWTGCGAPCAHAARGETWQTATKLTYWHFYPESSQGYWLATPPPSFERHYMQKFYQVLTVRYSTTTIRMSTQSWSVQWNLDGRRYAPLPS